MTTATLDVFVAEPGFALARTENVLLQVRSRPLLLGDLEKIASVARLMRVQLQNPRSALLGVLEETADVPDGPTRAAQAKVFKEFLGDPRVHITGVVLGEGARAKMLRTVVRLAAFGQPRMHVTSTVRDAAAWIVSHGIHGSVDELVARAEETRALAR